MVYREDTRLKLLMIATIVDFPLKTLQGGFNLFIHLSQQTKFYVSKQYC